MKVRERTSRISPHVWGLGLLEENDCLLRHTKEKGDTKGEEVCGGGTEVVPSRQDSLSVA